MSTLAAFVGIVFLGWGARTLYKLSVGSEPRNPSSLPDDLSRLRERYATTDMTTEEFEVKAAGILRHPDERMPCLHGICARRTANGVVCVECGEPFPAPNPSLGAVGVWTTPVTQRTEIHVHNAPPNSHLHIHLP